MNWGPFFYKPVNNMRVRKDQNDCLDGNQHVPWSHIVKSPGALPIRITCPWQNVTELSPFHNTCYASIVNKDYETGKIAPLEMYIYKAIGLRSFIKPFRTNGAWCRS